MEPTALQSIKYIISSGLGVTFDALHVHFGLGVFLLAIVLFRMPVRALAPLLAVALVALIGEGIDMYDDFARGDPWRWRESIRDIVGTVFWPGALWLFDRLGLLRAP